MPKDIKKQIMLIKVSEKENNNKFYEIVLYNDNSIVCTYGRVGTNGVKVNKSGGEREFNKILKEKTSKKKGYEAVDIESSTEERENQRDLEDIVMAQIKTDEESKDFIKKLIIKNVHSITNSTNITFDKKTGLFQTPLGPITEKGLKKANSILNLIEKKIKTLKKDPLDSKVFISNNINYFKLIPTKIKNLRNLSSYMLINERRIQEQREIIESLEGTIKLINEDITQQKDKLEDTEIYFNTSVKKLKDKVEFKRVSDLFEKTKNSRHGRSTNSAKVTNIFEIAIDKDEKAYEYDADNQMELWHGTKVVNLLSILKSGLLMPKDSPGSVTGYMFGKGLYFSDQSTKSLNYCDGMYWNSSAKENKIYLFLSDIAMGNYLVPPKSTSAYPPKGYDSYFAQGGKSGVMNNEMIVFRNSQIRLKYILEISL